MTKPNETTVTEPRTLEKLLFDAGSRLRYGGPNDPKADAPLPISRLRIRVHNPMCNGLLLPNGNLVKRGWSEIEVYSSDLDGVRALVADAEEPERMKRAREDYTQALMGEIAEVLPPAGDRLELYNRAEVVALLAEGNPEAVAMKKTVLEKTGLSVEGCYHARYEHSSPPLSACEVVEEMDPPSNPHEVAAAKTMAHAIATAVAAALAPTIGQLDALTKGK